MIINTINVTHIRNLKDCSISLSSSANLFFGPNGAGKTALVEAIYLMSKGQSFRGGAINTLINDDSNSMSIRINVKGESGGFRDLQGGKYRNDKFQLSLDGVKCKSFEEVSRLLPVQLIVPNASDLIFFGPEARRSFLDWGLFHVEQGYLDLARAYRRALKQRNAWLKASPGKADPWVKNLVELGVKINAFRAGYVKRLGAVFGGLVGNFPGSEKASLDYWGGGYGADLEKASALMQEIERKDVKAGSTSLGPHRADMRVYISGKPARLRCSRGQAKLISMCLALSQTINLQAERGINSVLLVDDVGAELDQNNLIQCFELIKVIGMQACITASNPTISKGLANVFGEHSVFHVEHGKFLKERKYGH